MKLICNGLTTLEQRILNSKRSNARSRLQNNSVTATSNQDSRANISNDGDCLKSLNPYFDKGFIQNLKEIFGDNIMWNLLPIFCEVKKVKVL